MTAEVASTPALSGTGWPASKYLTGDETGGTQDEAGEDAEVGGLAGIETFATGTDYGAGTDLVAVLRELGSESTAGEVPPELAALAEGGDFWRNCQEAIAERYEGLHHLHTSHQAEPERVARRLLEIWSRAERAAAS